MSKHLPNLPKALSKTNREEIEQLVDEKKALPDLVLKRAIFSYFEDVIKKKQALLYAKFRNSGVVNPSASANLRFAIVGAFDIIWGMVDEAKIYNLNNIQKYTYSDYKLCMLLSTPQPFSDDILIHLTYYVYYCLHRLNLTNLFVDEEMNEFSAETY